MTKTAIVKGIARWYGKNIVPKLPQYSPAKIFSSTAVYAIEASPSKVETIFKMALPDVATLFPSLVPAKFMDGVQMLLSLSDNVEAAGKDGDELFKTIADGLRKAIAEEEGMKLSKPGDPTKELLLRPADVELLIGEIKTAQTEIDNAAALAKANGGEK